MMNLGIGGPAIQNMLQPQQSMGMPQMPMPMGAQSQGAMGALGGMGLPALLQLLSSMQNGRQPSAPQGQGGDPGSIVAPGINLPGIGMTQPLNLNMPQPQMQSPGMFDWLTNLLGKQS